MGREWPLLIYVLYSKPREYIKGGRLIPSHRTPIKKYLIFIKKYNIIYIEKLRKINILPGGGMVDTPSFDLGYC